MNDSWWVRLEQLDDDQKSVIELPPVGNFLVTGPPGSGKSNLLLLRANYLTLSDRPNLLILVFTRTLEEFFAAGANAYSFSRSKISTTVRWQFDFLRQNGAEVPTERDFVQKRLGLLKSMQDLLSSKRFGKPYDTILVDEAQDLWPDELELLRKLSANLFVVADSRQKIYGGGDSVAIAREKADRSVELRYHYRNGHRICSAADVVGQGIPDYVPISPFSNYDETLYPSKVELGDESPLDIQVDNLVSQLESQIAAYPDGFLGVLCPTRETLSAVWSRLRSSSLSTYCVCQSASEGYGDFQDSTRVCVSTVHGAKGLEFRAVHLMAAEDLSLFKERQRGTCYVAITRAKTSLTVHHSSAIPGYLHAAIVGANPASKLPDLRGLFGSGR